MNSFSIFFSFSHRIEVRLGEYDLSTEIDCQVDNGCAPPVQDFIVEEIIPHPDYLKAELRNDIALIRLNRDAIMTACKIS